jgi:hypothetical protein
LKHPSLLQPKTPWATILIATTLVLAVCFTLVAYDQQIGAAVIYVPFYWYLCIAHPPAALFIMFGSALFPYDLSAGLPVKFALGEINLILATPFILLRAKNIKYPPLLTSVFIYFSVCFISIVLNTVTKDSIVSMAQMAVYLVLAGIVLANASTDARALLPGFYGIVAGGVFLGSVAIATRQSYVLGMHKNAAGSSLSFAAITCAQLWLVAPKAIRRRLGIAFCLISGGLLFTLSRGAWCGAIAGILFIIAYHGQFKLLVRCFIILIPMIAVCWFILPDDSKTYALDISSNSNNVMSRLISIDYAKSFFYAHPVFGSGVGLRKQYDATNVIWSTLAETGIVGLCAFLLMHLQFFAIIWRRRKLLAPTSAEFSIVAIAGGLVLSKLIHGLVDHYWARTLLCVWGSAAMAQGICMRTYFRRRLARTPQQIPPFGATVQRATA